ncbi:MAG TPA: SMI1/KNR4 family protein [Lentzea sp.]
MRWTAIESWVRATSPTLHAALRPPATDSDIAAAEEVLGLLLPAELVAWWQQFGGIAQTYRRWPLIPPHWQPLGLDGALRLRKVMIDAISGIHFSTRGEEKDFEAAALREPAGTPCTELWLPAWLPVATDGLGYWLFVDLRGGEQHACVVEWDKYSGADRSPVWPSVTAMLDETVRALSGDHDQYRLVFEHNDFFWE